MSTPQDFFNSIPFVTRYHIAGSLGATLMFATGVLSPKKWVLSFDLIFRRFEIWRLVSNQFIMGGGFPFVIRLLHLYKYGGELERGGFRGSAVEYSFFLFFGILVETLIGYFLELQVLSFATIHMIMYVWGRHNHNQTVSIMGVLTLKAPYVPWAFVVLSLILGQDPMLDLIGIFAGHCWWFLTDVLPKVYGVRLLKTPAFWYALWRERPPVARGAPGPDQNRTFFGGHAWGAGQNLRQD
eukprot:c4653_g1_i1.p1 GENE.c4653_g1_i1~~c4653_g1_i1.p1  ORF type:complete len:257 (+),score=56.77 c4653_g1_i1:53-772(+)